MLRFQDTDGNPISNQRVNGIPGVPTVMPVKIECRDGYFLWAVTPAGVTAEARKSGNTAWIDIVASPIDVTSYAPDTTGFELRLTPDANGVTDTLFFISETPQSLLTGGGAILTGRGKYLYGAT